MSEPAVDGRVRRGERNRAQIVEAIIAMIREGNARPTAEEVAKRAGVGARSLFRHFADMDGLERAVNERLGEEILPLVENERFEGSVEERVRALVRCRVGIFERIAPFRRREPPSETRSAATKEGILALDALLRRQLQQALGPELGDRPGDDLEVLDLLLSWESWNRLRARQRIGRERTSELLEAAALTQLRER